MNSLFLSQWCVSLPVEFNGSLTVADRTAAVEIPFERTQFQPFLYPAIRAIRRQCACKSNSHAQIHWLMEHSRIALDHSAGNWARFVYSVFVCLSRKCRRLFPDSLSTLHPEFKKQKTRKVNSQNSTVDALSGLLCTPHQRLQTLWISQLLHQSNRWDFPMSLHKNAQNRFEINVASLIPLRRRMIDSDNRIAQHIAKNNDFFRLWMKDFVNLCVV